MPDASMFFARLFGRSLCRTEALPVSLVDPEKRARLVDAINPVYALPPSDALGRLRDNEKLIEGHIDDVDDPAERMGIALRLWAGCLAAAKTIAAETRDGPNAAADRTTAFTSAGGIDACSARDPVYAAGVEAAPIFKRLQDPPQPCFYDGVPEGHRVLRERDWAPRNG